MMEQCKYCEDFYETNEGDIFKDAGVSLGWYCNECLAKMTMPPGEEEKLKAIPLKAIYWADFNLSDGCDTVQDEWETHAVGLKNKGYRVVDIECMIIPPFKKRFDLLFFDYGGLLPGAEGLMQSNCKWIIENAENHPSRIYVMLSRFTKEAIKDAMEDLGKTELHNIFLDMGSFATYYRDIYDDGEE